MTEQIENQEQEQVEESDDQLLQLPAERLVAMLRDKRKAEAAYRTKLRETETERDTLKGTVTGFQQKAFHQFAKGHAVLDTALDDVSEKLDIAGLLDESGQVDQDRAKAALEDLKKSRPHYFTQPAGQSGADFSAGVGEAPPKREATWGDVLS